MAQQVWVMLLWKPKEDLRKGGKEIRAEPWQRGAEFRGHITSRDTVQGQATDVTQIQLNQSVWRGAKQNKKQRAE